MPRFTIKTWTDGHTLFETDAETLKDAMEKAVASEANLTKVNLTGANLRGANLRGADLYGADLYGANLTEANLYGANLTEADLTGANLSMAHMGGANLDGSTILDTGETWDEYLAEVVPALLTAGGKTIEQVLSTGCWDCHEWANCPIHVALHAEREQDAPLLLRPRVRQFVRFFDAGLIPRPELSE